MSKVHKRKRIRKKSTCWLFYTKTEKGGACRLCQKEIISNGNTTNLLNHLKRKHTIQWESAAEISEDVTRLDSDSDEEEEEQSIELHRSPNETQQTHGLAYQSADGRTVIWLHPDVQMDQLSAAGFQPKITLLGQSTENAQEDTLSSGEQKDGEALLDMAEEVVQTEVIEEEDNTALSSEDALKTNEANFGERLHISESFVVDSDMQKDEVITNSGEVCQIVTVVTSTEALKEKFGINSAPKVSYTNPSPSTITVSSPQKVVVTHASSHKSKKLRTKKKCKHSSDNDDSFQSKSCKNIVHHKIDSQLEEKNCISRGCCELQKEDSFDHFGKYMATLLRNLPSRRSACRLQKEMINWVLKEQMLFED